MKFSEISKLAQNGEIQIGAVSLRRLEILWAGAQYTSIYSLSTEGVWEYTAGCDRSVWLKANPKAGANA